VLPFGIEYMLDIERLGRAWHIPIRMFFDVGANIGQTSSLARCHHFTKLMSSRLSLTRAHFQSWFNL